MNKGFLNNIVTIGGGKGHTQVLKALKDMPGIRITGICPSTDSGGSTGILRREYGGNGYIGDVTRCICALCPDKHIGNALLFRYSGGPIHGHSVKNLLFHSLERTNGQKKALEILWRICGLGEHRVIPVTDKKTELYARLKIGNEVSSETGIDHIAKNPLWHPGAHAITGVYLKPKVRATKTVRDAIKKADYIIICPGDLYSSIMPVLLPSGMNQSIKDSKAKVILILNIMTKRGETDNYDTDDFIKRIEGKLGKKANYIICNNAPIPKNMLLRYSLENKVSLDKTASVKDSRIRLAPMAMVSGGRMLSDPVVIRKVLNKIIK